MARGGRLLANAAACLAVVAFAVLAHVGVAQAESNGGVKIMPLGDSITDGYNVSGGYRIELWKKFVAGGYTVDFVGSGSNGPAALGDHDHEGHSGWTIAQIDSNITQWLQKYTPRTILLHIGTNDRYNISGASSRLGTLLDHITTQAPSAEVFVATIIPASSANDAVKTYNAQIPNLVTTRAAAGKHVHLVDMYSKLTTSDLADGLHPNSGGYAKMAAAWYDALVKVPGSLVKSGSLVSSASALPTSSSSRS